MRKCVAVDEEKVLCCYITHLSFFLSHSHTRRGQMQSNLSQSADQLPTQTDQCCRIFGELLPLRAPVSDVAYEMTRSLNISSPPGLTSNLHGTVLPPMQLSLSLLRSASSVAGSTANSLQLRAVSVRPSMSILLNWLGMSQAVKTS